MKMNPDSDNVSVNVENRNTETGSDGTTNPASHLAKHQWRPGVSGNPKGRAPRRRFIQELSEVLEERLDPSDANSPTKMRAVAERLVALCLAGNTKALAVFLPHVDPQRLRSAINVRGNANFGDVEIDISIDAKQALLEFAAALPHLMTEAGVPSGMTHRVLIEAGRRVGIPSLLPEVNLRYLDTVREIRLKELESRETLCNTGGDA